MYYKRNNYSENFETVKASDSQNISKPVDKLDSSKINVITTNLSSKLKDATKNSSAEGTDLQSRETSIIRGKQSNAIPVSEKSKEATNNGDSVMPYDRTNFTEEFSVL